MLSRRMQIHHGGSVCHAHVGTRAPPTKRCGKVTDYNQGCKAAHSHAVRDVHTSLAFSSAHFCKLFMRSRHTPGLVCPNRVTVLRYWWHLSPTSHAAVFILLLLSHRMISIAFGKLGPTTLTRLHRIQRQARHERRMGGPYSCSMSPDGP